MVDMPNVNELYKINKEPSRLPYSFLKFSSVVQQVSNNSMLLAVGQKILFCSYKEAIPFVYCLAI